jgi:conjugal transfer pilus assembly protein TraF
MENQIPTSPQALIFCTYTFVIVLGLQLACTRAEEQLNSQVNGDEYGILYFGRDTCEASRQQAAVLKEVEAQYGLPILPVTLDGSALHLYPDTKRDNGISIMVSGGEGITRTPSLYLVVRETQQAIPLTDSLLTKDEIVSRINKFVTVLKATQQSQR